MADGGCIQVSDHAAHNGLSKQAISKRIARLEAIGAIETRRGERGTKLAEFDRAAGEATDAIRELSLYTPSVFSP